MKVVIETSVLVLNETTSSDLNKYKVLTRPITCNAVTTLLLTFKLIKEPEEDTNVN